MSLPELFRHQDLFVGCLAIRRAPGAGQTLSVLTQAYDYASLNRCPALAEDGRCGIHDRGKPSVCSVVPFDAAVPDHLQHAVLLERNKSENYIGANCIVAGESTAHEVVVRDGRLVDAGFIDALAQRREAVRLDRLYWGDAVLRLLQAGLAATPAAARIPPAGYLSLSIVPVLQLVAAVSERCRIRCLAYIDSQAGLIERMLTAALQRQQSQDRATTRELRAFAGAHAQLRQQLERNAGGGFAAPADPERVRSYETYLKLARA